MHRSLLVPLFAVGLMSVVGPGCQEEVKPNPMPVAAISAQPTVELVELHRWRDGGSLGFGFPHSDGQTILLALDGWLSTTPKLSHWYVGATHPEHEGARIVELGSEEEFQVLQLIDGWLSQRFSSAHKQDISISPNPLATGRDDLGQIDDAQLVLARVAGHKAGFYRLRSVEPSHLWIHADPVLFGASLTAIQLEGVEFPQLGGPSTYERRVQHLRPVVEAVREVLAARDHFRFVPTNCAYAGFGQIGGLIYLDDGRTLQEVLLEKGLACVDTAENSMSPWIMSLPPELRSRWLEIESKARSDGAGYWSTSGAWGGEQ